MRAEAHALLSQWDEAEQRYRQAIDRIQDPTIRRSWWFNLASIASQLNDEAQRKAALAAALDVAGSDDISRRALELQRASQPLAAGCVPAGPGPTETDNGSDSLEPT